MAYVDSALPEPRDNHMPASPPRQAVVSSDCLNSLHDPPAAAVASVSFHALPRNKIPRFFKALTPLQQLNPHQELTSGSRSTMAGVLRERALSLMAAANNHGDLTVKISSLRQVKDIILSIEPSFAAELYSYLVELQSSPESLLRKLLIEVIEDIGLRAMEHSPLLMSVLLASLKDEDPIVARQSIISGQKLFCGVLREMTLQLHRRGKVERWLEELWMRMLKFKDDVLAIAIEPGFVGKRLLALKFLETYALLFTSDTNDRQKPVSEGNGDVFNISWLAGGFPVLDPVGLMSEANRLLGILLNLLQSSSVPGTYTVTVVSCLAAIARKRPVHYGNILSALLEFAPSFEMIKGRHAASIQYSIRSALLGFLRCMHPAFVESRERLLKALRAINAGDAADQVIRQVDKMVKAADRASRDAWLGKDDQSSNQLNVSVDLARKRPRPLDDEELSNGRDVVSKQIRFGPDVHLGSTAQKDGSLQNAISNGTSPDIHALDVELTPAEQMIAMIGALLAEGERGAESLEILISNIHPDLLADIVITNMKNLPKASPPLTRHGDLPVTRHGSSHMQVLASSAPSSSVQTPVATAQVPFSLPISAGSTFADSTVNSLPVDSKRDPRRDPRRLDPRRVGVSSASSVEEATSNVPDVDGSISLGKPASAHVSVTIENPPGPFISKMKVEEKIVETPVGFGTDQSTPNSKSPDGAEKVDTILEDNNSLDPMPSTVGKADEDLVAVNLFDESATKRDDTSSSTEYNPYSPSVTNAAASEDTCQELPLLPPYVDLTPEQQITVRNLAAEKIFDSCKNLNGAECHQIRLAVIARLVAQVDADDDIVGMLEKHVALDYQQQKGHELALHVLYHLHSLDILDSVESSSAVYEKFLLVVAKSLLDSFPASDKSFSRLLGEVPVLPDSTLELLHNLCYSDVTDNHGKDTPDIERVTQGLGTVWNLIVKRPYSRQACLDIALKCAMHSEVKIRATAIRLVANKLYRLSYISDRIEQYATNLFLTAVDNIQTDAEPSPCGSIEQRTGGEGESQETAICGSQVSDPGTSEVDSVRSSQPTVHGSSTLSSSEAERHISLLFALCVKKPYLLQLVFDAYGRAPRAVKEAVHEHIPNLITALGSSDSELLRIISDPPQGSEHLLALVLQVLTQGTTPSSDLIATVKHLYETKLKDVTILIPMLPSLSKNEVLPVFPRLVDLPLEKFQRALAHILQGSAHTRPALTPVEVLIAIHNIIPEKDGLALKKITDACSACFEQRTVFTQQVLAKALSQMVEQTPLPLLFMRTVIQAIDAFPTLVDFVMEILSKLVNRQVWRMPKLWFGFLKCAFQTQPHSFRVLLQLPPPQLENALNKYVNLKGPLAAYANQPSTKSTLSRPTLVVLGLENERHL